MPTDPQAYQGGTFVGNHVHKLLKVKVHKVKTYLLIHSSITSLCDSIKKVAADYPCAQSQANSIANKFAQAFELFGKCHRGYNSSHCLSNEDIDQLGKLKQFTYLG